MTLQELITKIDRIEEERMAVLNEAVKDKELWKQYRAHVLGRMQNPLEEDDDDK